MVTVGLDGGGLGDAGDPLALFSMDLLSNSRDSYQMIICWSMMILIYPPQSSHSVVMQGFDWANRRFSIIQDGVIARFSPLFSSVYNLTDCIAVIRINFLHDTYFKWKLHTTEKANKVNKKSSKKKKGTAFEENRIWRTSLMYTQDWTL